MNLLNISRYILEIVKETPKAEMIIYFLIVPASIIGSIWIISKAVSFTFNLYF